MDRASGIANLAVFDLQHDAGQGLRQGSGADLAVGLGERPADHHERQVGRGLVDPRQAGLIGTDHDHFLLGGQPAPRHARSSLC
jgi:hypothetical protein